MKNKTKITLDEFKKEVLYAQRLLEENNVLLREIEELQDGYNDVLIELERYREIIKVLAPEMIMNED